MITYNDIVNKVPISIPIIYYFKLNIEQFLYENCINYWYFITDTQASPVTQQRRHFRSFHI